MKSMFRTLTAVAVLVAAGTSMAANYPEAEPNEGKANATATSPLVPLDTLSGATTGTNATAGDPASRDFFRATIGASAGPGIYRNRFTFQGPTAFTGAIMGVLASGAASDTTTIQTTSTTTTPARFSQWYSFGSQHDLYYRVQGAAATTGAYSIQYDQIAITPDAAGTVQPGSVTMTTFGQGHTSDTEMFLYDSSFNLIRLNDDRPTPATDFQSAITQNLASGIYYLAIGNFNTASSAALEAAAVERSTSGARMDFAGSLVRSSSSTTALNVSWALTDSSGTRQIVASLANAYDMYWATFEVVPSPGATALFGLAGLAAARRRR